MNYSSGFLLGFSLPLVALIGCSSPDKPSLFNDDPALKIPAMSAARVQDRAAVRELVKDLDSDDPAVRFYAIKQLQRITGKTFNYHYYEDEGRRAEALKQWRQWLGESETAPMNTTMPRGSN